MFGAAAPLRPSVDFSTGSTDGVVGAETAQAESTRATTKAMNLFT
jgi:hypothetical protein